MMNKNWYGKKRLKEQLEFFGAKKVRFISCYAKKPRIRIENNTFNLSGYMSNSAVELGNYISGLCAANTANSNNAYLAQMRSNQEAYIRQIEAARQRNFYNVGQNHAIISGLCGLGNIL